MIRALKRKFVLISMLLVFVVLTLVLLGGILATRVQFAGIYHLALQRELATDLRSPNRHAFPVQRPEDNPGGRTPRLSFTVAKDADGAWAITTPWGQVEEDTLQLLNERALQEAGRNASPEQPLAHFSMEGDGGDGAALRLRLWTGGAAREWALGRADFHGRWIDWTPREDG